MTLVNHQRLEELLNQVNYDPKEIEFLCEGFKNGLDLGYRCPQNCRDTSDNIPFTVENHIVLWNKIKDEVQLGHFAGPYDKIPFKDTFVQSPIGFVPKAGTSGKTCLIFHLSYTFKNGNKSINHWTPEKLCHVKYNNLDNAVKNCLQLMKDLGIQTIFFAKSDLKSAFRILGILPSQCCYLILKA